MGNHQGKTLKIGSYNLNFVKQIAEGGFSYVFLVKDSNTSKHYALKRILIRDEEELKHVKHEIAIMKRLTKHKNIVKFIDYNKVTEKNTTEVFILMEYCSGGHLVEIMQKKLSAGSKFTDMEILKIFQDICESVAYMHQQTPLIIHRDLKVENVLLDEESGIYKLCDFGSSTEEIKTIKNKIDMQIAEDDISRNTTLQYRAPEIVDFYRTNIINEKIDIWALGCLLYKLLFYITPFEDSGSLGILNGNYSIPSSSNHSPDLLSLIKVMLNPDPINRPNIFEITNQVYQLRNLSPLFPNYSSNILTPTNTNANTNTTTNTNTVKTAVPKPLPKVVQQHHQPSPSPLPSSTVINTTNLENTDNTQQQQQVSPTVPKRVGASVIRNTPNTTPSLLPVSFPNNINNNNNFDDPFKDSPRNINPFDNIVNEEVLNIITQLTGTDYSTMFDTNLLLKLKSMKPGKGTMHIIVKRPLKEPLVCLKSLILVHALLSEGNNIQFKSDVYDSKDLFNNLYLGWIKQKDRHLQLGDLLSQYSNLLYKFITFHQKNYMIDGSFAFDEMKWGIPESLESLSHPISLTTIKGLFEIMDHIFLVQNSLSEYCCSCNNNNNNNDNTNTNNTIPITLLQYCVNILNSSSYSIFCFLSGSIEVLSKTFSDSIDLKLTSNVNQFQNMYQRLRDQYSKLSQLVCFSDIFFPTLPNTAPNFIIVRNSNSNNSSGNNNINRLSNSLSDLHVNNNNNSNNGNGSTGNSVNVSGHNSLNSSFDNTNCNPFSNEPTFNPFSTANTGVSPPNSSDFGSFGKDQLPPLPLQALQSPYGGTNGNVTPTSLTPGQMSPVIVSKKPPLPPNILHHQQQQLLQQQHLNQQHQQQQLGVGGGQQRFPHSASLEDARLYTLILTPSPSPPLSPSMGRLSHSNSNVVTQQQYQYQQYQQQQQHQHQQHQQSSQQQQQQHPAFDNFNINGPATTNTITTTSTTNNNNNNPFQSHVTFAPTVNINNHHNVSAPHSLNSSSSSISSQQQAPVYQKSAINNSLMPPPLYKPAARGHRRSQSSNGDEVRRRNLLQQQLEQNRDFLNHNRLINKQSRLANTNNLFDENDSGFGDEEEEDEGLLH